MINQLGQNFFSLALCNVLFFSLYLVTDIVFIRKHFHIKSNDFIKEIYRKTGHMGTCFILILATFLLPKTICLFLCVEALLGVISFRYLRLMHIAQVSRETNTGIYGLFIAVFIALLIPGISLAALQVALLILSISDTVASLIGKQTSFFPYSLTEDKKTISGSLAFFFSSLLIIFLFSHALGIALLSIPLIAYILTFVEALSYKGSDNFFLILLFIALTTVQFYQILLISGIMTILVIYYAQHSSYNKR